jgi:Mg2+/citrate symporter
MVTVILISVALTVLVFLIGAGIGYNVGYEARNEEADKKEKHAESLLKRAKDFAIVARYANGTL